MSCYHVTVLKPVNNNIASHIIDGDNWEGITALFHDLKCYPKDYNKVEFTAQEVTKITSIIECFLNDECYIKDSKTYHNEYHNQIYNAKTIRAMLPFLKQCDGFSANWIETHGKLSDDFD